MKVLVVGGTGGIGAALVRALCARPAVTSVVATYYRSEPGFKDAKLRWRQLDVTDDSAVASLFAETVSLDTVINTVGILHTPTRGPEKSVSRVEPDFFMENIRINTLPTLLLAKYARAALKGKSHTVFATVSARVGSIGENRLGGWYSYRCSKAALNMALKTLSIEWRRSLPGCVVAALHPGTTDTPLSRPFQSNVSPEKLFIPERTAGYLLTVIDRLTPADTGRYWSWDGSELPW